MSSKQSHKLAPCRKLEGPWRALLSPVQLPNPATHCAVIAVEYRPHATEPAWDRLLWLQNAGTSAQAKQTFSGKAKLANKIWGTFASLQDWYAVVCWWCLDDYLAWLRLILQQKLPTLLVHLGAAFAILMLQASNTVLESTHFWKTLRTQSHRQDDRLNIL